MPVNYGALSYLSRAPSKSLVSSLLSRVFILLSHSVSSLGGCSVPPTITVLTETFSPPLTASESSALFDALKNLVKKVLYEHKAGDVDGTTRALDLLLSTTTTTTTLPSSSTSSSSSSLPPPPPSSSSSSSDLDVLDARIPVLLATLLPPLIELYHSSSIADRVSPPKLVSVDWRVGKPTHGGGGGGGVGVGPSVVGEGTNGSSNGDSGSESGDGTTGMKLGSGNGAAVLVEFGVKHGGGSGGVYGGGGYEEKVLVEISRAGLDTFLEGLGRIRDQLNKVA